MTAGECVFAVTMTVVIVWLVAEVSDQDVTAKNLSRDVNKVRLPL